MGNFVRDIGSIVFRLVAFLAFLSLPVIFFIGLEKASTYILPWVISLAWICVGVVIFILLPLSLFKKLRVYTGIVIYITSFVFGLLLFLFSLLTTWSLWGGFWAFVGVVGFGGLIVPFALLATLFNGLWLGVGVIAALLAITWGSRFAGLAIAMNGEEQ
jgi:hypothetical protein